MSVCASRVRLRQHPNHGTLAVRRYSHEDRPTDLLPSSKTITLYRRCYRARRQCSSRYQSQPTSPDHRKARPPKTHGPFARDMPPRELHDDRRPIRTFHGRFHGFAAASTRDPVAFFDPALSIDHRTTNGARNLDPWIAQHAQMSGNIDDTKRTRSLAFVCARAGEQRPSWPPYCVSVRPALCFVLAVVQRREIAQVV
jgi:hypothetical protein